MMLRSRQVSLLTITLALAVYLASFAMARSPAWAAEGAWKESTQEWYDQTLGESVRRTLKVWDLRPELDLEFHWEPANSADSPPPGIVNGSGTLTWRKKGTDELDTQAIYSRYKGDVRNGRPEGHGSLVMRSGLTYDGDWKDGLMNGRGAIKFENGDDYEGEFVAGRMDGNGRYGSSDGSVYVGVFRNGLRNGEGKLTLADGSSFATKWQDGAEVGREPVPGREATRGTLPPNTSIAYGPDGLALRLLIDRKMNQDFLLHDEGTVYYVYEAENAPGELKVQLASKKIMSVWKGDGVIGPAAYGDGYVEQGAQFAPVYLLADVTNNGKQTVRVIAASLSVTESTADPEPYLSLSGHAYFCGDAESDTNVELRNYGWTAVRNATLTYAFGSAANRTANLALKLGTFERDKKTSVRDGLQKFAPGLAKKIGSTFPCASEAEAPACLRRLEDSGLLGELRGRVRLDGRMVMADLLGRLDYEWVDESGRSNSRSSPVAFPVPLFVFAFGGTECGGPDAVDHSGKALQLALNKRNYPVQLNWRTELAPRANARFGLIVGAPKSSHHVFRVVLQLSDGNKVSSPQVDLSYFRPRIVERPSND
jgi:hypothetical protein